MRTLRSTFLCLVAAGGCAAALAQAPATPGVPRLVAFVEDGSIPIELQALDASVRIHGFLAETTLDMTFFNADERLLEGELLISLPDGAVVCGYGLDVEGVLVDGVVVEKDKARIVFEREAHRQVDPGIIEWAGGNLFRTRVYPIFGESTRTVRIRYAEQLRFDRREAVYRLPLSAWPRLQEAKLKVEIVEPERFLGTLRHPFAKLDERTDGGGFVAEAVEEDLRARRDLEIVLGAAGDTMVLAEDAGDATVFAVADLRPPRSSVRRRGFPRNLALFWDASFSRHGARHGRALRMLEGLLRQWRPQAVSLVVFREQAEPPTRFDVAEGRAPELLAALREMVYDGATGWRDLELPPDFEADAALVFSDGRVDFGPRRIPDFGVPAYVFHAGGDGDHQLLRHLAESHGGAYFDLGAMAPARVLRELRRLPVTLRRVVVEAGEVTEILAPIGAPVRGSTVVTGRLAGDTARLSLVYGTGQDDEIVVPVVVDEPSRSDLVSRLRAQQKLARLSLDPDANREELLALGRAHGLVTPWTSLIVLESVEQYVEYGIEPPASLPEWRFEYQERLEEMEEDLRDVSEEHLQTLRTQWQEYLAWSEGTWEPPADELPADDLPTQPRTRSGPPPDPFLGLASVPQSVRGVVTDDAGAPLPGVVVEARSAALQGSRMVISGADGAYRLLQLPPGEYQLTYELEGFSTIVQTVRILRGQSARLDAELPLASVAEAITVTSATEIEDVGGESIQLEPWNPDTPYLAALTAAADVALYEAYLRQREKYGSSPAFFVDSARHFLDRGLRREGLRIASNLLELGVEEPRLVRVAANLFLQAKAWDRAVVLSEMVAHLRPELPQSSRDLAQALMLRGRSRRGEDPAAARADFERAARLLHGVAFEPWGPVPPPLQVVYADDGRFEEIGRIALVEYNRVLQELRSLPASRSAGDLPEIDSSWIQPPDADLRIVLTWDDEYADMDLWVIEPTGEKVFYSNPRSKIGGLLSEDCVNGLGPESYLLRDAMPGTYRILVDYYSDSGPELLGPVTVQTVIVTGFGREDEQVEMQSVRLESEEESVEIGTVTIGAREPSP